MTKTELKAQRYAAEMGARFVRTEKAPYNCVDYVYVKDGVLFTATSPSTWCKKDVMEHMMNQFKWALANADPDEVAYFAEQDRLTAETERSLMVEA